MFRISKLADYALVLLAHLAREEATPSSATELARASELPIAMVSKILKLLAGGGLLRSSRGARGGYQLAVPASRISVADVLRVIEGDVALTACSHLDPGRCDIEKVCPIRPHLRRLNDVVLNALQGVTIAALADPRGKGCSAAGSRLVPITRRPTR